MVFEKESAAKYQAKRYKYNNARVKKLLLLCVTLSILKIIVIDDKKIEEAANLHRFELIASMHGSTLGTPMQCFEEEVDAETDLIENSFITGAKWAIKEFLKNLWHPASEEPEGYNEGILLRYNIGDYYSLAQVKDFKSWKGFVENMPIDGWLYIDDLLPKQGGNQ